MATAENTFDIQKDSRFSGIEINTKTVQYQSVEDFQSKLTASLEKWKEDGVRAVWIKVAKEHSSVVPICTQAGFDFHHAQPGYVMLKKWLPTTEMDICPSYANQYLGCAGFVVNDQNQVLVIKEKYHSPDYRHWKLPGGHANAGEEIEEAAQREVLEETGVDAEFETILTFRHQHQYQYGCSDFYFVCLMRPKTTEIRRCNQEIAEASWMSIDEYENMPGISPSNKYIVEKYKEYVSDQSKGSLKPLSLVSYNKKYTHLVYSVHPPDSDSDSVEFD